MSNLKPFLTPAPTPILFSEPIVVTVRDTVINHTFTTVRDTIYLTKTDTIIQISEKISGGKFYADFSSRPTPELWSLPSQGSSGSITVGYGPTIEQPLDWYIAPDSFDRHKVIDGALVVKSGGGNVFAGPLQTFQTEIDIQVSAKWVGGNVWGLFGVSYGNQEQGWVGLLVSIGETPISGRVTHWTPTNLDGTSVVEASVMGATFTSTFKFRLFVQDGRFQFSINNQVLNSFENPGITYGKVTLDTWDDKEVAFDDLQIYETPNVVKLAKPIIKR